MYITIPNSFYGVIQTDEQPNDYALYWVNVGDAKWERWPAWQCRRCGIHPRALQPVDAQEGQPPKTKKELEQATKEAEANDLALEHLEEHIDDCLMAAKGMDRKGLEPVILLLRKARNAVVWQLGQ